MAGKRGRGRGHGRGGKGGGNGRAVAGKISVELPPGVVPPPNVELPSRVTREANKTAHPGLLDAKQPRRTAAEMEEARAAEAAQDAAKELQRQAALQKVAAEEDAMRREDARRALEAFTGPTTPQAVDQSKETTGQSTEVPSPAEDSDVEMLDNRSASTSEVVSSPDFDAYVPPLDTEIEESAAKTKTKKQHHRKSTRDDVRAQRQTSDEPPVSSIVAAGDKSNKRKAAGVADNLPAKKCKKTPPKPGGIDTKALKEVKDAADHAKKTNDDSMVRVGGFAEDDEDDGKEREGILGRARGEPSVVKIAVPETTVLVKQEPIYQAKTKKEARGGLNKWLTSHLPTAHQSTFRLRITPHMRAKQGTRLPWASVLIEDVQEALDIYAPGEKAVRGGPFVDLVTYRLNDSRTNMAKHAISVVQELFSDAPFFDDADLIKKYVEHALKVVGEGSKATSPMWWQHWGDDGKHKGFLQSDLILATFSIHLAETVYALPADNPVPPCSDPPIGALILAGQAVEHALKTFKTGTYKAPTFHFSASNYADYHTSEDGVFKLKRRATRYVRRLQGWSDETWADVRRRAQAFLDPSITERPAESVATPESNVEDDDDFDVESDDELPEAD